MWIRDNSYRLATSLDFLSSNINRCVDLTYLRQRISCWLFCAHCLDATFSISRHSDLQVTLKSLLGIKRAARVSQTRWTSLNVNGCLRRRQNRSWLPEGEVHTCVASLSGRPRTSCRSTRRSLLFNHPGKCGLRLHAQLAEMSCGTWRNWWR